MISVIQLHYKRIFKEMHCWKYSLSCMKVEFGILCGFRTSFIHIFLKIHINIILLTTHTHQNVFFCLVSFSEVTWMRYLTHVYSSLLLKYALI
jgi:hypothetical protein